MKTVTVFVLLPKQEGQEKSGHVAVKLSVNSDTDHNDLLDLTCAAYNEKTKKDTTVDAYQNVRTIRLLSFPFAYVSPLVS